jgi:hypothetical protein
MTSYLNMFKATFNPSFINKEKIKFVHYRELDVILKKVICYIYKNKTNN